MAGTGYRRFSHRGGADAARATPKCPRCTGGAIYSRKPDSPTASLAPAPAPADVTCGSCLPLRASGLRVIFLPGNPPRLRCVQVSALINGRPPMGHRFLIGMLPPAAGAWRMRPIGRAECRAQDAGFRARDCPDHLVWRHGRNP
jgi:hypothetical protein